MVKIIKVSVCSLLKSTELLSLSLVTLLWSNNKPQIYLWCLMITQYPLIKLYLSHYHTILPVLLTTKILFNSFLFLFILLSYNTYQPQPPLSLLLPSPLSNSPPPEKKSSTISLQKRVDLPGISTEQSTTRCNKTRHTPSYQGWTRQLSRRERVPRAGKRVRDSPTPTVRSPTRIPS